MLNRRQFLAAAGAALVLPQLARAQAEPPPRPNIIFILADDLAQGDVGCYGSKILKTPNIDRLAAEGTMFTNAYSGSMVCAPSRCMLMTGKHPGHATVRNNWEIYPEGQFPLRESDVTVAQVLKGAGYATGLCGKWGLGGPETSSRPSTKGFDFHFGYNCQRHAHRFYTDYLWRNDERVELPQSPEHRTYAQELIAQESLKFIRGHKDGPFFLYCAYTVPHGGYTADNVPGIGEAYKDKDWSEAEKVYATMVDRLDSDVGAILDLLKELGLEEKTLVIFASDNGAQTSFLGGTGGLRGMKGTLFEGGLNVPLIARWPGRVPAGNKSGFMTAFWDFLPTAAELAGAPTPKGIDGISLVPMLMGKEQARHEYLYWEQPMPAKLSKAVRMGDWKGYQDAAGKPVELYDLKTDRAEKNDVAAQHPDVVAKIEKIMTEAHVDTEIPTPDPRTWELYDEVNAKLDAKLGIKRAAGAKKKRNAAPKKKKA